jgi:hypothetical protein
MSEGGGGWGGRREGRGVTASPCGVMYNFYMYLVKLRVTYLLKPSQILDEGENCIFAKIYAGAAFRREIWEVEPSIESGMESKPPGRMPDECQTNAGRMPDGNRWQPGEALEFNRGAVRRCRPPSR